MAYCRNRRYGWCRCSRSIIRTRSQRTGNPAAFLAEKEAEYTKLFANPYNAAKYGYIDDVIEPRNTRFRIIRALQQLQTKKLTNPAKKHGNIPHLIKKLKT